MFSGRAAAMWNAIRRAETRDFLVGKREPTTPAWKRFKELVGDTEAGRKLFAEMMADDLRAELIEKAEASPLKAAEVYAAEVTRAADAEQKSYQQFAGRVPMVRLPGQSTPMADASRKVVPFGEVVAVLFLGARSLPVEAKDPVLALSEGPRRLMRDVQRLRGSEPDRAEEKGSGEEAHGGRRRAGS
jgi:hypothetical protein